VKTPRASIAQLGFLISPAKLSRTALTFFLRKLGGGGQIVQHTSLLLEPSLRLYLRLFAIIISPSVRVGKRANKFRPTQVNL